MKVGVIGAKGQMGAEVCRAVEAADDLKLVAAIDVDEDRKPLTKADVVVDFTAPSAVMDNLKWCIAQALHCVVGTPGFNDPRLDQVRAWLADAPSVNVLIAPNFGIA